MFQMLSIMLAYLTQTEKLISKKLLCQILSDSNFLYRLYPIISTV